RPGEIEIDDDGFCYGPRRQARLLRASLRRASGRLQARFRDPYRSVEERRTLEEYERAFTVLEDARRGTLRCGRDSAQRTRAPAITMRTMSEINSGDGGSTNASKRV